MSDDTKPRDKGCTCHMEEGDSPCPVHDEDAATQAFNRIAAACGCPEWDYPGQIVRDVEAMAARLAAAERERDEARDQWSAQQRIYNARAVDLRQANVDRDAARAHAEAMAGDLEDAISVGAMVDTTPALERYRAEHPKKGT